MSRKWLFFLCLLFLPAVLPGCSEPPRPDVVAEAAGWSLTLDTFIRDFERAHPGLPFGAADPATRRQFLTDRVNAALLVDEARDEIETLSWPQRRRVWAEEEDWFIDHFFEARWGRFEISEETRQALMARFSREAHLQRIIPESNNMVVADSCYRAIVTGDVSFEDAYDRYGTDLGSVTTDFELGWLPPAAIPNKVARHVFLDPRSPGDVLPPVFTRRGIWIVRVVDFRPATFEPGLQQRVNQMIHVLCYQDTLTRRSEEARQEAGFKLFTDNFPVVNQCFNAFWDSIAVASPRSNTSVFRSWRAPIWHLPEAAYDTPIYEFDGRVGTAKAFMEGLNRCDTRYWPGGPTREHREAEIRERIERLFVVQQARNLGLHETEAYREAVERFEADAYLDDYFARFIEPKVEATPEEIRAELSRGTDRYRIPEKAAFSLLVFPTDEKERADAFHAAHAGSPLREWYAAAAEEVARSQNVFYVRDSGVLDLEGHIVDPRVRTFAPFVEDMERDGVSDVIETPDGYAIVRCTYRRHTTPLPPSMLETAAAGDIRKRKTNQVLAETLDELHRARNVQLYPERLVAASSPAEPGT